MSFHRPAQHVAIWRTEGVRAMARASIHVCMLLALFVPVATQAQGYPSKPLRFIVAYPPGGANDLVGRHMAAELAKALKQTVYVENRPGAGAVIGTKALAEAPPDGYTLGMATSTSIVTGPLLYKDANYRPLEDFLHVAMIGTFPNVITVRADHPARSIHEFLAGAKKSPNKVNYGSAGIGSIGHLTGELLTQVAGVNMLHIPYKGTAQATLDLLGGQIEAMFDGLPTAAQQTRAGRVRMLATTGLQREQSATDIPTLSEAVPGLSGVAWLGIAVPAKTPAAATIRLRDEFVRIIAAPETRKSLLDLGMTPTGITGQEFTDFIQSEIRKWGQAISAANVRVE